MLSSLNNLISKITNKIKNKNTNQNLQYSNLLTADEVFQKLKEEKVDITIDGVEEIYKGYLIQLKNAIDSGQEQLIGKLKFLLDKKNQEISAVIEGFNVYIEKDNLATLVAEHNNEEANRGKHIFLCELSKYMRPLPDEVVEAVKKVKENNIFDALYILFTEHTSKAKYIANTKQKEGTKLSEDPIIFGMYTNAYETTNKYGVDRIIYSSDRMYVVASWIDKYCDLDITKLSKMKGAELKAVEYSDLEKELADEIKQEEAKVIKAIEAVKNLGISNDQLEEGIKKTVDVESFEYYDILDKRGVESKPYKEGDDD